MSWFGWGKSSPTSAAIHKQAAKAKEHYAQPEYRRMAMDKLLEWSTPESLEALASRFSVVVQSPHWDEEEKSWLVDEFVKKGDLGKQVLIAYIQKESIITHALEALTRLIPDPETRQQILMNALATRHPDDYRSSDAKATLITALSAFDNEDVTTAIIPYLNDHSDDVKCTAIDVIQSKAVPAAFSTLIEIIFNPQHSARVLRHAAKAVFELKLPVEAILPLPPEVAEDFSIQQNRLVRVE